MLSGLGARGARALQRTRTWDEMSDIAANTNKILPQFVAQNVF